MKRMLPLIITNQKEEAGTCTWMLLNQVYTGANKQYEGCGAVNLLPPSLTRDGERPDYKSETQNPDLRGSSDGDGPTKTETKKRLFGIDGDDPMLSHESKTAEEMHSTDDSKDRHEEKDVGKMWMTANIREARAVMKRELTTADDQQSPDDSGGMYVANAERKQQTAAHDRRQPTQ